MAWTIFQLEIAVRGDAPECELRTASIQGFRDMLKSSPVQVGRTATGEPVYLVDIEPVRTEVLRDSRGTLRPRRPWDGRSYDDRQLHR